VHRRPCQIDVADGIQHRLALSGSFLLRDWFQCTL
jgi:hypothetical protein